MQFDLITINTHAQNKDWQVWGFFPSKKEKKEKSLAENTFKCLQWLPLEYGIIHIF